MIARPAPRRQRRRRRRTGRVARSIVWIITRGRRHTGFNQTRSRHPRVVAQAGPRGKHFARPPARAPNGHGSLKKRAHLGPSKMCGCNSVAAALVARNDWRARTWPVGQLREDQPISWPLRQARAPLNNANAAPPAGGAPAKRAASNLDTKGVAAAVGGAGVGAEGARLGLRNRIGVGRVCCRGKQAHKLFARQTWRAGAPISFGQFGGAARDARMFRAR